MIHGLTVLAIGGNSLITDKSCVGASYQHEALKETAKYIAGLAADGAPRLVITHANGPQVGFIYRRGQLAQHELPLVPLDICGADTQGAIGYMIQKALSNEFTRRGMDKKVTTVVTQTVVDREDSSFKHPTKPIGSFVSEEEAFANKTKLGWEIIQDAGRGYRRVVPSPLPIEIIELEVVELLVQNGYVVVAAGGGGVPVIRNEKGELQGIEAVVDKDLASSLLAKNLGADTLIISTAVDAVYLDFGQKDQKPLGRISLSETKRYMEEGHFKPGSMKPKVEAMIEFVEAWGKRAIITSPENLLRAISGQGGTIVTK